MIDYRAPLCHTVRMSRSAKKIIAILMLLWMPIFTGNALATSVVMQMPAGHCHEESMQMADMDMGDVDMHHMSDDTDDQNANCHSCSVCHLACTGYLGVADVALPAVQIASGEVTPYLVDSHSFTSAPLLPPPLARA